MPETHFTPGPWEADTMATYVFAGIMMVCEVRGWGYLIGSGGVGLDENAATEVQRANARLIAAAPDLLDALLRFVDWYDTDATEEELDDAYYEAQHAICEALGERATSPSESRDR